MAKSIRSKVKRVFRTAKAGVVATAPWKIEAEKKRQDELEAIVNAPRPERPAPKERDPDAPVAMEADAKEPLPELTTKNPGKILRKLRARRLAVTKGINKAPVRKKSAKPLAGANQFHKKNKKR